MITLIDYGGSNLRSVGKALEYLGAQVHITSSPEEVRGASKLILPGVGAFEAGMKALRDRKLDGAIQSAANNGIPLLGICLGMQLLFDSGEEMGAHQGLGLIDGAVLRFPDTVRKIPHMGWNQIEHDGTHKLLNGVAKGAYGYFVHSYYCQPSNDQTIIGATDYGQRFAAIIGKGNVFGIQFHPEKSQKVGLRVLKNYLEMN